MLRYPKLQAMYGLDEGAIYEYVASLRDMAVLVNIENPPVIPLAPIRDAADLATIHTALRGSADLLCSMDDDFHSEPALSYCLAAGIEVVSESGLIARLGI